MIYKIIVDKQSRTNPTSEKKEYTIDIEELRVKGDVYDSLVITKDEDYVMRRLSLSELQVLSVLEEPIKQPLPDLNIELFEGDNYIYLLDMTGNKFYAEYLVKNDFNDIYVTTNEMNSAINQSASQIELSVNQKLTGYSTIEEMNSAINQSASAIELSVNGKIARVDGEIEDISASLELKVDKNDNDQVVSMINASADEINLRSNRLVIDSTNFKLNSAGNITATGGTVGGFTLGDTQFVSNFSGIYNYSQYDLRTAVAIVMDWLYATVPIIAVDDYNNDGEIDAQDFTYIQRIINGQETNTKNVSGTLKINAEDPKKCIAIETAGTTAVSIGAEGIDANIVNAENMLCGYRSGSTFTGVLSNGHTGKLTCVRQITGSSTTTTEITPDGITTPTLTQTSLESEKKNFNKLENALDIIKDIDIYKYNLKAEEDDTKKHIGFVIGDKFKYSEEVTSNKNDGVDIYSFVAVCCKAIQEQQEQIEKQDNLIQSLIERIENLEKGANNEEN